MRGGSHAGMSHRDNIVRSEWTYFLDFLRREMKPVFIFMPILGNTICNIVALIFFYTEAVALTSSSETVYVAAIIYTAVVFLLLLVQFTGEFITPRIKSQPVYDPTSIDNVIDVWAYRFTAAFQWGIGSFFLWADVIFQEYQCDSNESLCLNDNYVDLHRIIMLICTAFTFSNLVFLSQNWYGYARPNYDPLVLARRVYHQYLLDDAYNSPNSTELIVAIPPRSSSGKKRRAN